MRLTLLKNLQEKIEDSSDTSRVWVIFGILVYALLVIAVWPWLIIFALNTLFPILAINFNFWTWLSICILNVTYNRKNFYNKD